MIYIALKLYIIFHLFNANGFISKYLLNPILQIQRKIRDVKKLVIRINIVDKKLMTRILFVE